MCGRGVVKPRPDIGGVMLYTLDNGKVVTIPDDEIENSMIKLELSRNGAIHLWLEDNDYEENEEQALLDEKAKKVKIQHGAGAIDKEKVRKERTIKVSDEKKELFETILKNLDRTNGVCREDITVLKENKLISCVINGKIFKIDIIETRPPKKK